MEPVAEQVELEEDILDDYEPTTEGMFCCHCFEA